MKSQTAIFLIVILIIKFSFSTARACEIDLLSETEEPITFTLSTSETVLRQRMVTADIDALLSEQIFDLCIKLFDNVNLTALFEQPRQPLADGSLWIGRIKGIDNSQVTMAVTNSFMSVTIEIPDFIYKIRPIDGEYYLVREIINNRLSALNDNHSISLAARLSSPLSTEYEVLDLVNEERAENNLYPLSWNNLLFESARGHSTDMAEQNYFSHNSQDGRKFSDRITNAGYEYNYCAENIAAGYGTPRAVIDGWISSPGHYANILSDSVCELGVGYAYEEQSKYRHYWTQNFGRQSGVTVCNDGSSGSEEVISNGNEPASSSGSNSGGCFIWNLVQ